MSRRINAPEDFYKVLILSIPLMLPLLALHYWKPRLYWDSERTTNLRNLIGDHAVYVLGYATILIYYLGMFIIWLTNFSGLQS